MLRCLIPAGEMTSMQLRGLADLAQEWGGGYADITTRANFQVREIAPRNMVKCLLKLQEIGLTARGSGVDNVRNITATPTAGIDKDELIDTRPFAKALHYYILNNRDLYDLPRKFNVAFDGGGSVTVVADTNDIGFIVVRVPEGKGVEPGIYFRVELAGITGHQQFAKDSGILVKPDQCVAVAAAIIRAFVENGDRTNRKERDSNTSSISGVYRNTSRKLKKSSRFRCCVFHSTNASRGRCRFSTAILGCLNKFSPA